MVALTIAVLLIVAAMLSAMCIDAHRTIAHMQAEHERAYNTQLVRHLEFQRGQQEDVRALTHSLCRANSVPYIPPESKRVLEPSPGWFDKKPAPPVGGEIKVGGK